MKEIKKIKTLQIISTAILMLAAINFSACGDPDINTDPTRFNISNVSFKPTGSWGNGSVVSPNPGSSTCYIYSATISLNTNFLSISGEIYDSGYYNDFYISESIRKVDIDNSSAFLYKTNGQKIGLVTIARDSYYNDGEASGVAIFIGKSYNNDLSSYFNISDMVDHVYSSNDYGISGFAQYYYNQ